MEEDERPLPAPWTIHESEHGCPKRDKRSSRLYSHNAALNVFAVLAKKAAQLMQQTNTLEVLRRLKLCGQELAFC